MFKFLKFNSISVLALGENGSAVIVDKETLSAEERSIYDVGYEGHGFNRYVSDKISVHRSLPDIRYDR